MRLQEKEVRRWGEKESGPQGKGGGGGKAIGLNERGGGARKSEKERERGKPAVEGETIIGREKKRGQGLKDIQRYIAIRENGKEGGTSSDILKGGSKRRGKEKMISCPPDTKRSWFNECEEDWGVAARNIRGLSGRKAGGGGGS